MLAYAKLAGMGIAAVGVGFFVWHYLTLKGERDTYMVEAQRWKDAQATTQASLDSALKGVEAFQNAMTVYGERLKALSSVQSAASRRLEEIDDVFAKHDFQRLLDAKPGLILRRVNSGSRNNQRMFECATARTSDPDCDQYSEALRSGDTAPTGDTSQ